MAQYFTKGGIIFSSPVHGAADHSYLDGATNVFELAHPRAHPPLEITPSTGNLSGPPYRCPRTSFQVILVSSAAARAVAPTRRAAREAKRQREQIPGRTEGEETRKVRACTWCSESVK